MSGFVWLLLALLCLLLGLPWFALIALLSLLVFHGSELDPALLVMEFSRLIEVPVLAAIPLLSLAAVLIRAGRLPERWQAWLNTPGGQGGALRRAVDHVIHAGLMGFAGPLAQMAHSAQDPVTTDPPWLRAAGHLLAPAVSVVVLAALLSLLAPARAVSLQALFMALLLPWLLLLILGYATTTAVGRGPLADPDRPLPPPWELPLLLLLAVSIYLNWLSILEAAALAVLILMIGLILPGRGPGLRDLPGLVVQAMRPVGIVLVLFGLALPWALALSDLSLVSALGAGLTPLAAVSPAALGVLLALVWLVAGYAVQPLLALIVLAPLIFPAALASGMPVLQLSVLSLLGLALGQLWPGRQPAEVDPGMRRWLLAAAGLLVFALYPGLSLWLPGMLAEAV